MLHRESAPVSGLPDGSGLVPVAHRLARIAKDQTWLRAQGSPLTSREVKGPLQHRTILIAQLKTQRLFAGS